MELATYDESKRSIPAAIPCKISSVKLKSVFMCNKFVSIFSSLSNKDEFYRLAEKSVDKIVLMSCLQNQCLVN